MNRANWVTASPEGAKALTGLHHFVTTGTALPPKFIHLVFLRVSQINGCAHCIDIHTRDLLKAGMSIDTAVLVPREKDLVDLTLTIAAMNAINRMGVSFRLKPRAKSDN